RLRCADRRRLRRRSLAPPGIRAGRRPSAAHPSPSPRVSDQRFTESSPSLNRSFTHARKNASVPSRQSPSGDAFHSDSHRASRRSEMFSPARTTRLAFAIVSALFAMDASYAEDAKYEMTAYADAPG